MARPDEPPGAAPGPPPPPVVRPRGGGPLRQRYPDLAALAVEVTAAHAARGRPRVAYAHPLAFALKALFPGRGTAVRVRPREPLPGSEAPRYEVHVHLRDGADLAADLPPEAAARCHAYDEAGVRAGLAFTCTLAFTVRRGPAPRDGVGGDPDPGRQVAYPSLTPPDQPPTAGKTPRAGGKAGAAKSKAPPRAAP